MGRPKKLPRWVLRHGDGFRGWAPGGKSGTKRYFPTRPTPEEAHADAAGAREARMGARPHHGTITLAQGCKLVLDDLGSKVASGARRPGTVSWYEAHFRILKAAWSDGSITLDGLAPESINAFARHRLASGVNPNTVRSHLRALSRVYTVAMRKRMVSSSPMGFVDPVDAKPARTDWMSRAQVMACVDAAREDDPASADLALFLFATGLRRTEAVAVDLAEDLDLDRGVLNVRRGKKRPRVMALAGCQEARDFFGRLAEGGGTIVPGESLEQRAGKLTRSLKHWAVKLKEPRFRAHALRHSLGSHMASCGVPKYLVSAALGHGEESITDRYVHAGAELRDALDWAWRERPT